MEMFKPEIYTQRRGRLREQVESGLILLLGNEESPMNYPANTFHFRQDSTFLYFFGLDFPLLAGVIDVDEDRDIVFGDDVSLEDIIWMGYQPSLKERAMGAGVKEALPSNKLGEIIKQAVQKRKKVHFLPPYQPETKLKLTSLLDFDSEKIRDTASVELIKAVIEQRSIKIKEEIDEMERAHSAAYDMHTTAMRMAKPGVFEREIAGRIEGIALTAGGNIAFPVILTVNGQILHNHFHGNILKEGHLLVNDSGAESELHYASDITRTIPVGGKFTQKQKEVYEIVLRTQESSIQSIRPDIKYRDIHLKAAKVIASGLKDLDLMKGDVDEAVKKGAHALFFPHGLGHMIGLDVHDMENLGEDYVGYDEKTKRNDQFGIAYLRLAKELQSGHVLTVEPGIYFIPALIDKWKAEKKHTEFINYTKLEDYRDFGGIRIEDNVLVLEDGHRILGKSIPKKVDDLEEIIGTE